MLCPIDCVLAKVGSRFIVLLLAAAFAAGLSYGQGLVEPEELPAATERMNNHPRQNSLKFYQVFLDKRIKLDYNFRYQTDFSFQFPSGEMPEGGKIHALVRATPKGGAPVMLSEQFEIPPVRDALNQMVSNLGGEMMARFGGRFTIGPGIYQIELLLFSEDGRTFFKKWRLRTEKTDDPASLTKANLVDALAPSHWVGRLDPNGIRLTLLLNATTTRVSNAKLWDYVFLMQMASSILELVPCRSIRLVAFNLDKQAELFRQDNFDSSGWKDLAKALTDPQFVTVDYRGLIKGSEPEYLAQLVESELTADTDAVIIVGRSARFINKTPKELKRNLRTTTAGLFYLQQDWQVNEGWDCYYGGCSTVYSEHPFPLPDSLAYLVGDLRGMVLHFWTAREFYMALDQVRTALSGNRKRRCNGDVLDSDCSR